MGIILMMAFVPTAIVVFAAFVIFIILMAQIYDFFKTKRENQKIGKGVPSSTSIWVLAAVLFDLLVVVGLGVLFMKTIIFDIL